MRSGTGHATLLGLMLLSILGAAERARAEIYTIDFFPPGLQIDNIVQLGFVPSFVIPDIVGGTLDNARLVIDFTTANNFNAENLLLLLVAATPDSPSGGAWPITGADLGWSGQGNFTADISTSELNGVIVPGVWTFDLYADVGDPPAYSGAFTDETRFEITYTPVPEPATGALLLALAVASRRRRVIA
jgi:hypothetical protein